MAIIFDSAISTGGNVVFNASDSFFITSVNTDNIFYPTETFDVVGNGFGATQGTGSVGVDGEAFTVNTWSDTVINVTAIRGGNNYGANKTLTVITDSGLTGTIEVEQEAEPGTFAVTAINPNITDDASLWTGLIDTVTSDPITIVAGDQAWVKNPNNLTNLAVAPDGEITADVTGDFVVQIWLQSDEVWGADQTVTFEEIAPTGNVSIGTISVTATTASVPFSYSGTDAPSFEYRISDGVFGNWITTTSPISITGLTQGTAYTIEIRSFNTGGTGTVASGGFTTDAVAVDPPAGTITFGTVTVTDDTAAVPFSYSAADQDGFEYRLEGEVNWTRTNTSPVNLLVLEPDTNYTLFVRAYNSSGESAENSVTFRTLEQAVGPPLGSIVFAVPTRGSDLIVQQFFYEAGDAANYQYKVDAGEWLTIPFGPIGLQDLTEATSYTISVRPVNAEGTGDTATTTVTTRTEADIVRTRGIKR